MSQSRPSARPRHDTPDRLRRVEGRHNSLVKELRSAFARAELTEAGDCAIEGLRIVEEAIRSGLRLHAVFFSESAETRAERLLPQLGAHVETVVLPDKLFSSAVPSETPQGVAALVRYRQHSLQDVLGRIQAGPVVAVAFHQFAEQPWRLDGLEPELRARADAYLARIDRDLEANRRHQELHRGHLVELVHEADRELITPEHIRRFSVTGTADELVERVHALEVDGVNELAIQPGGDVADELRRLASAFRSAGLLRSPDGS